MTIPLHDLLKQIRTEKGLTLEELAIQSHVSLEKLQHYEKGSQTPSIQTILKLSSTLEIPANNLLDSLKINQ